MYLTTLHCHALASSRMPAACCMSCNSSYHISRRSIVVCVVFSLKKANICSISCNCSTKLATLWVNGHSLVPFAASGHIWSRVGHMLDLAVSTLPTAHSPWANTAKSETYELTVSNHTQFLEVWNVPLIGGCCGLSRKWKRHALTAVAFRAADVLWQLDSRSSRPCTW